MIRKRIIPVALIDQGGRTLTSQQFCPWRTVGTVAQSVQLNSLRGADELVVYDIAASRNNRLIAPEMINKIRKFCDAPLTIGGGICSKDSAKSYIQSGADKVSKSICGDHDLTLISKISSMLGSQSVVAQINYMRDETGITIVDYLGGRKFKWSLNRIIIELERSGVGEIILCCVSKDGSQSGFDEAILPQLNDVKIGVPVLLMGGAGNPGDFVNVLGNAPVQGALGSSVFAFSEHTPRSVRSICRGAGIKVRDVGPHR